MPLSAVRTSATVPTPTVRSVSLGVRTAGTMRTRGSVVPARARGLPLTRGRAAHVHRLAPAREPIPARHLPKASKPAGSEAIGPYTQRANYYDIGAPPLRYNCIAEAQAEVPRARGNPLAISFMPCPGDSAHGLDTMVGLPLAHNGSSLCILGS